MHEWLCTFWPVEMQRVAASWPCECGPGGACPHIACSRRRWCSEACCTASATSARRSGSSNSTCLCCSRSLRMPTRRSRGRACSRWGTAWRGASAMRRRCARSGRPRWCSRRPACRRATAARCSKRCTARRRSCRQRGGHACWALLWARCACPLGGTAPAFRPGPHTRVQATGDEVGELRPARCCGGHTEGAAAELRRRRHLQEDGRYMTSLDRVWWYMPPPRVMILLD